MYFSNWMFLMAGMGRVFAVWNRHCQVRHFHEVWAFWQQVSDGETHQRVRRVSTPLLARQAQRRILVETAILWETFPAFTLISSVILSILFQACGAVHLLFSWKGWCWKDRTTKTWSKWWEKMSTLRGNSMVKKTKKIFIMNVLGKIIFFSLLESNLFAKLILINNESKWNSNFMTYFLNNDS